MHSMYPSTCLSVLSLFIHLSILSILVGQPWQMLPRSSKHALDVCQGHQRFEVPNYSNQIISSGNLLHVLHVAT